MKEEFNIGDQVCVLYTFRPHKTGTIKRMKTLGNKCICLIKIDDSSDWLDEDWVGIKYLRKIKGE